MIAQIVNQSVLTVAQQLHIRSHACFSARNVAPNASAFLLVHMATSKSALATTAGRQRKGDPNALKALLISSYYIYIKYFNNSLLYNATAWCYKGTFSYVPFRGKYFSSLYLVLQLLALCIIASNFWKPAMLII